jgi:putative transposase
MPRRARAYLSGMPYHIVQRGNNREACFYNSDNYRFYLSLWKTVSKRYGVAVHAYCLMTNHIHFLVTPTTEGAISRTMSVIGSRYAFAINRQMKRSGTLWEGRHKSSLIDSDNYLLACYRYIEQNPVRASMVFHPKEYEWSSYRANTSRFSSWLEPHKGYLSLGNSSADRIASYTTLLAENLDNKSLSIIRKSSHYCQPVGDSGFREKIERKYGVKLGYARRGRPRDG